MIALEISQLMGHEVKMVDLLIDPSSIVTEGKVTS